MNSQNRIPPCDECEASYPGRRQPRLLLVNETCLEVHDLCFEARGDLSGNLDYGFLVRIMDLMDIEAQEQLDIIYKIKRVERFLKENRQDHDVE
ncbi:MAG: hypothetical protein AB1847_11360 [bacterium]